MSPQRHATVRPLPRPPVRTDEVMLTPELLATQLDAWAFRREKVIFVLDHHKAREARGLARRCRDLVAESFEPGTSATGRLAAEWREVRQAVARLFASSSDVRGAFDPRRTFG